VYEWFVTQRSKNIPVSGPLLQERARQSRQELGGATADHFKASNGWLEKFRIRHGIQHRVISGESAAVDPVTVNEWNDGESNVITVDEDVTAQVEKSREEDDDMPAEPPPKLVEAMEMVRRLHLLANTQHPHLYSLVSQLDSHLTQLFIDSKSAKQTTIDDFFRKIE
jgi:hypothetical protein